MSRDESLEESRQSPRSDVLAQEIVVPQRQQLPICLRIALLVFFCPWGILQFMIENKDVTCTRVVEVIRTLGTTPATLLASILAALLFGCSQQSAVRERSDWITGSRAATITIDERRKVFTNWTPVLNPAGACASRNGKLTLYRNGSWEWEAETMSSDDRNRWKQTFHFYDSERPDRTWFGSRAGGSWDLDQRNVWTYWRYGRGAGDVRLAEAFDRIGYVEWEAGC